MSTSLKKGMATTYLLPLIGGYVAFAAAPGFLVADKLSTILGHGALAALGGVAMLVFQDLFPRPVKETLIFWRIHRRVPGFRAFSKIARNDHRIDQERLAALIPATMTPEKENALWYTWLKDVEADGGVSDNHRRFLALRDCAVLSLTLAVLSPAFLVLPHAHATAVLELTAISLAAYLLFMVATRNTAVRLVGNVIALKVAKPDKAAPKSRTRNKT